MKTMRYLLLSVIALLGVVAASCINDDITTSSTARLAFSVDTLSLDTVFTETGTPTARLIVFNRNKSGVNISSIKFRNPDTPFRLNVDGVSGSSFENVEIRGGDSIYIFVACTLPAGQGSEPKLTEDALEFQLNGNTQSVTVEAWGQNVTRLRNVVVEQDMTLTAQQPYVVFDSLTVAPGATLKILPGARLLFHDKAKLVVNGRLEAVGTPGNIIQMRGDRTGDILTNVSYDLMSGQWNGIRISAESFDNLIEYVDMRSTSSGLSVDSCSNTDRLKLLIRNSWLHNSKTHVFKSTGTKIEAVGVCFSDAAQSVVSLRGGDINFSQCTIANYYLFSAVTEPLLCLYHCLPDDANNSSLPLMKASFDNCIIYGLGSDINTDDLTGSEVFLRYVLLKSEGTDDANFQNCLWGKDPLFYTERENYLFNYRLRPESPAIGAGNPAFAEGLALTDYYGLNRLSAGNPALGAFVYVQPTDAPGLTSP